MISEVVDSFLLELDEELIKNDEIRIDDYIKKVGVSVEYSLDLISSLRT
jgi:hypothetical protein